MSHRGWRIFYVALMAANGFYLVQSLLEQQWIWVAIHLAAVAVCAWGFETEGRIEREER